jgi:hypothetical protein
MDPFSLAAAAVTALAAYFGRQVGRAATEGGDAVADRLFGLIESHFTHRPAANAVLSGFVGDPDNSQLQDRLGTLVGQLAMEDAAFRDQLAQAVEQAAPGVKIGRAGTVAFGGNVIQQGTYVAGGDQHITNGPDQPTR